jgi:hypothetical protein
MSNSTNANANLGAFDESSKFAALRRHATIVKQQEGNSTGLSNNNKTKDISPESPLNFNNNNNNNQHDRIEEEYEKAKYEEELIKERIRDRESYEKTGKIKSIGLQSPHKKSSVYSLAQGSQRNHGGNHHHKMTQEEVEKLTLEDLTIDSDPEDDEVMSMSHRTRQSFRERGGGGGGARNSELDIASVISEDRQSRDTSKRSGTNSRRTIDGGRSVGGASSNNTRNTSRKALQLAQKEALAIENELKKEEDERIAEISKSTAEEDYKLLQAAKERKKEALVARENRKYRERWGLSADAPVNNSRKHNGEHKLEPEFELASDNPFDTSGGMIDRILAQNNVTPTASTPPTRRIQRSSDPMSENNEVVEEQKDWFVQLQESLFGCCIAGGTGSGREGKTPEQKAAKAATEKARKIASVKGQLLRSPTREKN